MPALPHASWSTNKFACLVGLWLLIRLIPLFVLPSSFAADPDAYRQLAETLVNHRTFGFGPQPTAYRPPLYPLLLTLCVMAPFPFHWAAAILHLSLGLLTIWLTWQLARRCFSLAGAILASLLVACDPLLLYQSTQLMTETLAALLAVLLIWTWTRACEQPSPWRFALAGICLGLASLCRPTFLPWLALAPLTLLATPALRSRFFTYACLLTVATLTTLSPWVIRNQRVFDHLILNTTHGGYTLMLGNNTYYYEHLRRHGARAMWNPTNFHDHVQRMAPPPTSPSDELANDFNLNRAGHMTIRDDPDGFRRAAIARLATFWGALPQATAERQSTAAHVARQLTALWYAIILPLALLGIVRWLPCWRQPPMLATLALFACFTVIHLFHWTDLRMRAPLMPLVALASTSGVVLLAQLARVASHVVQGS